MVVAEVVEVVEVESSGSGDVRALVLSRRTNPPYVAPRDFRPSAPKSRSQIISSSQPEGGKRGCAPRSASRLEEAIRTTWFFLISREMKYTGTEIQGQGIPSSPSFPSCRQRASAASRVRGDRGEGFLGSWMGGGRGMDSCLWYIYRACRILRYTQYQQSYQHIYRRDTEYT